MEFCHDCGSQMIHTEGCALCPCCGYSACGCEFCSGLGKGVEDVQSSLERKFSKDNVPA